MKNKGGLFFISASYTFFLLASAAILFTFNCDSCKDNDPVGGCTGAALPDLNGDIEADSNYTQAGSNFYFGHQIENIRDVLCDETLTAGRTQTAIAIDYAPDQNMPLERIYDTLGYLLPSIAAGSGFLENYAVNFTEQGIYRLTTFADGTFLVEERREDNNEDKFGATGRSLGIGEEAGGLIITVYPNPHFERKKEENLIIVKGISVIPL